MSIECSECERDLRGGHADDCSRRPKCVPYRMYTHWWKIEASDWDNPPAGSIGCATCQDCKKQAFAYRCSWCGTGTAIGVDECESRQ